MKDALFLHMGPGLHSETEKEILGPKFPTINFWNQPQLGNSTAPFNELTQSCDLEIKATYRHTQKKIKLLAHSFGGLIALGALENNFNLVAECTFFSTGFHFHQNFLNLLSVQASDHSLSLNLRNKMLDFLGKNVSINKDNFLALIETISHEEDFMKRYWYNKEIMNKYLAVSTKKEPLHIETFLAVSFDLFDSLSLLPRKSRYEGPIKIIFGKHDPLLDIDREILTWSSIFPKAQFLIDDHAGHFTFLENKSHLTDIF